MKGSQPVKRKPKFTFKKVPAHYAGGIAARRLWELKSICMNDTRRNALAIAFRGASVEGVIRVTMGGMTLVNGSKTHFLNWDEVAEALQNAQP
jgi:hypothetical protein